MLKKLFFSCLISWKPWAVGIWLYQGLGGLNPPILAEGGSYLAREQKMKTKIWMAVYIACSCILSLFHVLSLRMKLFTRNLFSFSKIALKLAYGNVEFQKFPGVISRTPPPFKGKGRNEPGRGGKRMGKEGEREGGRRGGKEEERDGLILASHFAYSFAGQIEQFTVGDDRRRHGWCASDRASFTNIHREMPADLTTETVIDIFAKTKKRVLDFVL